MKAGDLKHRIQILEPARLNDAGGGNATSWVPLSNGNVWAAIEPLSASESYEAAKVYPNVSHKIRIRYLGSVKSKHRVKYGDRIFHIGGVINTGEDDKETVLFVSENPSQT